MPYLPTISSICNKSDKIQNTVESCKKYGFDSLIISGSYGGHRRHMTDDSRWTTDNTWGMA